MLKIITENFEEEILDRLASSQEIKIISPYLSQHIVEVLLEKTKAPEHIKVLTKFDLWDFSTGASSVEAIKILLERNAEVKEIPHLHSKLYLYDNKKAIITSANFTNGGITNNYELGISLKHPECLSDLESYFEKLWEKGKVIDIIKIENWEVKVKSWKKELRTNKNKIIRDIRNSRDNLLKKKDDDVPNKIIIKDSPLLDANGKYDDYAFEVADLKDDFVEAQEIKLSKFKDELEKYIKEEFSFYKVSSLHSKKIILGKKLYQYVLEKDYNSNFRFGGGWVAFNFFKEKTDNENPYPNISINIKDYGLEFMIDAENKDAQKNFIDSIKADIKSNAKELDGLLKKSNLVLKTYIKIQYEFNGYATFYWILQDEIEVNKITSSDIVHIYNEYCKNFERETDFKEKYIQQIIKSNYKPTELQIQKMRSKFNKTPNLALRFVDILRVEDGIWDKGFDEQAEEFYNRIVKLKPFIDFFLQHNSKEENSKTTLASV